MYHLIINIIMSSIIYIPFLLNKYVIFFYIYNLYTMNKSLIIDKIYELNKNDIKLINIFKLIHTNKIRYDYNNNGVYFDIDLLNNELLMDINDILNV